MLVVDLIKQSLGLLGYLPEDEPVQADDAARGLRVLNMLGGQMALDGEWEGFAYIESSSTTLVAPLYLHKALAYRLALDLAPYYSIQPTPAFLASLRDVMSSVRLRKVVNVGMSNNAPFGEGNIQGFML